MAKAEVEIIWPTLYKMTARGDGAVRRWLKDYTDEVAATARRNVYAHSTRRSNQGRRTGALVRSINSRHRWANQTGASRDVGTDLDYAIYVHEGTGPVIVAPGGKKMPIGRSQGSVTGWAREVRGQRANPFLADAARTVARRHR